MKRKVVLYGGIPALLLVGGAAILRAQFGLPQLVYDPSNTAQTASVVSQEITNGVTMVNQFNQMVQLYRNAVSQFSLMQQQAMQWGNKTYWQTLLFQVGSEVIKNHYGETVNFAAIMNGNYSQAVTAWTQATYTAPSANFMGNVTAQNSRRMSEYATVQLMDQTSTRCAQILAQYASTQAANQAAISQLQSDTMSSNSGANTAVAVANIQTGGNLQAITLAQSSGNVQACIAEQQTLQAKLERDRMAANAAWYSDVATSRASTPSQIDPAGTAQAIAGGYLLP